MQHGRLLSINILTYNVITLYNFMFNIDDFYRYMIFAVDERMKIFIFLL